MPHVAVPGPLALLLLVTLAGAAGAEPVARRPLVAIVADNAGTETTDFVIPYGVLARSGVAEVVALALADGPIELQPALRVEADATIAAFARAGRTPDFVVVPAVRHDDDPVLRAWLRAQAERGATIVSICDGVKVLAGAGLLAGRAATGHWFSLDGLADAYPDVRWVRDRRWVADGPFVTTTGVSASLPASLALVERIAGRARAEALARELGVAAWSDAHDSSPYALTAARLGVGVWNWLRFWRHERIALPIADGADEIALAFTADAFARTYRARPLAMAAEERVVTRSGLVVLRDAEPIGTDLRVELDAAPGRALDEALGRIAERYGAATAELVAVQLEHPWEGRP